MKRLIALLLIMTALLTFTACGNIGGDKNTNSHKFPDVFGIDYNDAIAVLEAEGFEVSAIAAKVDDISVKLLYPLEKVTKGTVFKIDDYILDNNGNITLNYEIMYGDDAKLLSNDKTLVIYYAKEDYALTKETPSTEPSESQENTSADTTSEEAPSENVVIATESEAQQTDGIRPDFKAAMDSYEQFMDEYVAFMEKYYANPSDTSLLLEYADYLTKYAEFVSDFDTWQNDELNSEELAYYIEVQGRVSAKLLALTPQ